MSNETLAKQNKAKFLGAVLVLSVLAIASFGMLGVAHYEFLIFDVDRNRSKREVDRLKGFAVKQEAANAAISDELARREALLISRQQLFEEFNTLTGQVAIVRKEIHLAREELNQAKETRAVEQGSLTAARNETVALDERRQTLNRDISAKAKELSDVEASIANLKKQLVALGVDKTSALAATDMARNQLVVEVEQLTNVTVRVEAVRSALQESEKIADKSKNTLATLTLKIQAQEAKLAEQTAATTEAERMTAKLKNEIVTLWIEKAAAQAAADALESNVANTAKMHTNILVKVDAQRKILAQLEDEIDKIRKSRDTLAAQVAATQEMIKVKTDEKQELEAVIFDLIQKKAQITREPAKEIAP